MIKRIIFVEDGTVDLDGLNDSLGEDTKVIVYRQGATPPSVLELREPARYANEDERDSYCFYKEVSSLNARLRASLDENNDLSNALTVARGIICDKCGKENSEDCENCKLNNSKELIKIGREI